MNNSLRPSKIDLNQLPPGKALLMMRPLPSLFRRSRFLWGRTSAGNVLISFFPRGPLRTKKSPKQLGTLL
jgi:hypothetical protein